MRVHRYRGHRIAFGGAGHPVVAGVRIHSGPGLGYAVISATTVGMRVRIIGYSGGFAQVRTSTGILGWIESGFIGSGLVRSTRAAASIATTSRSVRVRRVGGVHAAATIRLHATAGLAGTVIGMVYAGTHLRILGSTLGWDYIRLPNGRTGYVERIRDQASRNRTNLGRPRNWAGLFRACC